MNSGSVLSEYKYSPPSAKTKPTTAGALSGICIVAATPPPVVPVPDAYAPIHRLPL